MQGELPTVATLPEIRNFLDKQALTPFLEEVRNERVTEIERVARYVELALTELVGKEDQRIGKLLEEKEKGAEGAAGLLAQAETRQTELLARREKRRRETFSTAAAYLAKR